MRLRSILADLCPPLVARWLRPKPTPKPVPVPEVHVVRGGPAQGLRMKVNAAAPAFQQMLEGSYDDFLWKTLDRYPPPAGLILDIGAHIGYHSLCFAVRYPAERIIAFEPNPVNLGRFQENMALSPAMASRIAVRALALSDTEGTLVMRASSNVEDQTSSGGYIQGVRPVLAEKIYRNAGFAEFPVEVERLDALAKREGWGRIGLIKLDVEGAEHLVLRGAVEVLRTYRPLLLIEIHSVACMLHVQAVFAPLGYAVELIHEEDARRAFVRAWHRDKHSTGTP